MAQDASIKLTLDTSELLQEARKVGPELEKALSVKTAVPGVEKYQQELRKAAENAKVLNKETGEVDKAFTTKALDGYDKKLEKAVSLAAQLQDTNRKLKELGVDPNSNLAQLRGKIGGAARQGDGAKQQAQETYNAAKPLLAQQAYLQNELNKQLSTVTKVKDAAQSVVDVTSQHGAAITEINTAYTEIEKSLTSDATRQEEVSQNVDATVSKIKDETEATKDATAATEQLEQAQKKATAEGAGVSPKGKSKAGDTTTGTVGEALGEKETKDATQSALDLATAISQVREKFAEVRGESSKSKEMYGSITDLLKMFQQLRDAQASGNQDTVAESVNKWGSVAAAIERVKQAIIAYKQDVKECADEHTKAGNSGVNFGKVVSVAISGIKTTIGGVVSGVKTAFSAIGSAAKKAGAIIKSAFQAIPKVLNSIKGIASSVARSIKSAFNGIGSAIKGVRSHFLGMANESKGNFKHMITNITKYVLGFRSLFFLVRRIRKYIGEGIQSMAKFSDGHNSVNTNISKLLTSLEYLKNAWATAFDPILQFVTPWLTALLDKLAAVGNAFSRFLGNILGASKVFQAVKGPTKNYAKSLDKAGKSAGGAAKKQKKLNDRLADFDDLHVLGKDTPTSGSGGGGGSGGDDEDKKRNNKLWDFSKVGNNLKKALKDMWASADFTELGKKVSAGLINALNKIDWNKIKATAYKIGKSIATFLNGALGDPGLWEAVGSTLAQGLNTITKLLGGFLENSNVDFGGNFANLIIKFFNDVDWSAIAKTLSLLATKLAGHINSFFQNINGSGIENDVKTFVSGLVSAIVKFISGIDWSQVIKAFASLGGAIVDGIQEGLSSSDNAIAKKLGEFVKNIKDAFANKDPKEIIYAISDLFQGAFDGIDVSSIIGKAKGFVTDILDAITGVFKGSDNPFLQGISGWISAISDVLKTGDISTFITDVISLLSTSLGSIDWNSIFSSDAVGKFATAVINLIQSAIKSIDWGAVASTLATVADNIITGIASAFSNSDNPILQGIGSIITTIKDLITSLMPVIQALLPVISQIIGAIVPIIQQLVPIIVQIVNALVPIIQQILPVIQAILPPIVALISQIADMILPVISSVLQVIMPIIQQLVSAILPVLSQILTALQPLLEVIINNVLPFVAELLDAIMPLIQGILQCVADILSPIIELIAPLLQLVMEILTPILKLLKPVFSLLGSLFQILGAILKPILELISPLLKILVEILSPIFHAIGAIADFVGGILTSVFNTFAGFVRATIIPVIDAIKKALQFLGQVFHDIGTVAKALFDGLCNGFKALWDFIKKPINGIIGGIEAMTNGVIKGLNFMIKALNKLSFTVPDWVPLLGGKKFGFNLKEINTVSIPRLAQGAVIPPNNEFLAMLGDQSHGTNIEAPLDTIKQAVAEVLATNGNQEVIQLLQQLIAVVESKNLVIGDKAIGQANARYTNQQRIIRGTSF